MRPADEGSEPAGKGLNGTRIAAGWMDGIVVLMEHLLNQKTLSFEAA